jgi:hypothetical protein
MILWLATAGFLTWGAMGAWELRGVFLTELAMPEAPVAASLAGHRLPDATLRLLEDPQQLVALRSAVVSGSWHPHQVLRLYVVFSGEDCYSGFSALRDAIRVWDTHRLEIPALGIVSGESPHVVRYTLVRQSLELPTYYDSARVVSSMLARAELITPAVVLAKADGTIIRVAPVTVGAITALAEHAARLTAIPRAFPEPEGGRTEDGGQSATAVR